MYEMELVSRLVKEPDSNVLKVHFRKIFEAGIEPGNLLTKSPEYRVVLDFFRKHGKTPDPGTWGKQFPGSPLIDCPEPVDFYIEEVVASQVYSAMTAMNTRMVGMLEKGKGAEAANYAASEARKILQRTNVSQDVDLTQTVPERIRIYDDRRGRGTVSGIPSGWPRLDQETTGWQRGEFNILVGRTGSYKSWSLISWCHSAWSSGCSPLFFSREMDWRQVARRFDAYITKMGFRELKTGKIDDPTFQKFGADLAAKFGKTNPLRIISTSGVKQYNTDFIRSKIDEYRPDIVFIDGLYMMVADRHYNADYERHMAISRGLKAAALEAGVPIIGSTQANRGSAGKKKQDVQLHQIAYSDAYSQDADNIIAINRKYDPVYETWSPEIVVELIKAREGENIKVPLTVDLDNMKFSETTVGITGTTANTPAPGQSGTADDSADDDPIF